MSTLASQIIGEGDSGIPLGYFKKSTAPAGKLEKTNKAGGKTKNFRLKESEDDEALIPDGAVEYAVKDDEVVSPAEKGTETPLKDVPDLSVTFDVALALVAPDCTPDLDAPLSPSKVPNAASVLGVIPPDDVAATPTKKPQADVSQSSVNKMLGLSSASGDTATMSSAGMTGESMAPTDMLGAPMQEHKAADIREVMGVFRKFSQPQGNKAGTI